MEKNLLFLLIFFLGLFASAQTIVGTVSDYYSTLPGASVSLKNSEIRTKTDLDGNFTIQIDASHKTLIFSCLGYHTKEITIDKQKEIHVSLNPFPYPCNQVGYDFSQIIRETDFIGEIQFEKKIDAFEFEDYSYTIYKISILNSYKSRNNFSNIIIKHDNNCLEKGRCREDRECFWEPIPEERIFVSLKFDSSGYAVLNSLYPVNEYNSKQIKTYKSFLDRIPESYLKKVNIEVEKGKRTLFNYKKLKHNPAISLEEFSAGDIIPVGISIDANQKIKHIQWLDENLKSKWDSNVQDAFKNNLEINKYARINSNKEFKTFAIFKVSKKRRIKIGRRKDGSKIYEYRKTLKPFYIFVNISNFDDDDLSPEVRRRIEKVL